MRAVFPITLLALAFAINLSLLYRLFGPEGELGVFLELRHDMNQELERNQRLRESNDKLRLEIADIKNGVEVIEEIARHDLGLVREGETFINFVGAPVADEEPLEPLARRLLR